MSLYVTDQLPQEEAEAFERHYFGCERCWDEVQRATEIRAALGASAAAKPSTAPAAKVVRGPWTNWRWLATAAAAGIAAAGAILFLRSPADPTAALIAAARDRGTSAVQARLAGFPYLPPAPVMRGGEQTYEKDLRARNLWYAAVEAEKKADEHPTAANLHAAGVAHLLIGEWNEAIEILERGKKLDPANHGILDDLTAAYLQRGIATGEDADLRTAFELSKSEPGANSPERKFNGAWALELRQTSSAGDVERAWDSYLRVDSASPWARVAREHRDAAAARRKQALQRSGSPVRLAAIEGAASQGSIEKAVRTDPEEARRYLEDELLPLWGRLYASGAIGEADAHLREARMLSAALTAVNGDRLGADSVYVIDNAMRERPLALSLAQGHLAFGEGRSYFAARRMESALRSFRAAGIALGRAGSPFEAAARMEIAACVFNLNDYPETARMTSTLEHELSERPGHIALLARVHWLQGLLVTFSGETDQSLRHYRQAAAAYERLGEKRKASFLHDLIAEMLGYLSETKEAWHQRDLAFACLGDGDISEFHHQALGEAARAAMEEDKPQLAITYLKASERLARSAANPIWECDAHRWLALAYEQARMKGTANVSLQYADLAARQIGDPSIRTRSQADVDLAAARILRAADPIHAEQRATAALAFFQRIGSSVPMARCLAERGRIYRDSGRIDLAERDLVAACAELEKQRTQAPDDTLRISFFDSAQTIFAELIDLLWKQARPIEALAYSERARARALLDDFRGLKEAPLPGGFDPEGFAKALPPDVALVEYRILPDRILIWVVYRGVIQSAQSNVPRAAISDLVAAFGESLRSRPDRAAIEGDRLSSLLIRPIEGAIAGAATLVVVPEGELFQLPFAALASSKNHRHLVEDYSLEVAPSMSLFLEASQRLRKPNDSVRRFLLVGNPAGAAGKTTRLSHLPGAEGEVRGLATRFKGASVLEGAAATPQALLTEAPRYSVVHFAGHATTDVDHPGLSGLVLSPDRGSGNATFLTGRDIAATRFSSTRLVFLAACSTAAGPASPSEGSLGIARAFIAAGVPAVVATLWPIDDAETERFSARFYGLLAKGVVPLDAIRQAQLATREPSTWAAFELFGGLQSFSPKTKEDPL